ncbi:hypothetical protein ACQ86N_18850 [Puia sp. P3]|uniref:hypothetical protein n=1 Tax=Puia sp. P3 TaxID=3423952 RepID=UPI003D67BE88
MGYGEISCSFSQAIPALKSGFYPNSISTDIHVRNINGAMKDLLNTLSKFMALGMPLDSVIAAATLESGARDPARRPGPSFRWAGRRISRYWAWSRAASDTSTIRVTGSKGVLN